MAWFPAPYLEKLDDDGDEDETDGAFDGGECRVAVGREVSASLLNCSKTCSLNTPFRDGVHGGQELQGHQKRRDQREHGLGGGGPAEV